MRYAHDQLGGAVDAKPRGIQAQVIVADVAPVARPVTLDVLRSPGVHVDHLPARLLPPERIARHRAGDQGVERSLAEDVHPIASPSPQALRTAARAAPTGGHAGTIGIRPFPAGGGSAPPPPRRTPGRPTRPPRPGCPPRCAAAPRPARARGPRHPPREAMPATRRDDDAPDARTPRRRRRSARARAAVSRWTPRIAESRRSPRRTPRETSLPRRREVARRRAQQRARAHRRGAARKSDVPCARAAARGAA